MQIVNKTGELEFFPTDWSKVTDAQGQEYLVSDFSVHVTHI